MSKKRQKAKTKKPVQKFQSTSHPPPAASNRSVSTVEDWIQAGDAALHTRNADQAVALFSATLDQLQQRSDDDHTDGIGIDGLSIERKNALIHILYDKRAEAKLSMGDQEGARNDYQSALESIIESDSIPLESPSAELLERKGGLHLYIGQLSEGKEALQSYQLGIDSLQMALLLRKASADGKDDDDDIRLLLDTRQQLVRALCNSAELFLTDLCFESTAEQDCEDYIQQALKLNSESIDALQAMANLRLSQNRGIEAIETILHVFARVEKGCVALASLVGLHDKEEEAPFKNKNATYTGNLSVASPNATELENLDDVQQLPGFEFRCQTAKILLECGAVAKEEVDKSRRVMMMAKGNQCVQAAIDVLGSLLAENDEVVEIWLLTGEAFKDLVPTDEKVVLYYWNRAKEMLNSIQESLEQHLAISKDDSEKEDELKRQLEEVRWELEQVTTKLNRLSRGSFNATRNIDAMEE